MAPNSFERLSCVLTGEDSLNAEMAQKLRARLDAHFAVELAAFIQDFENLGGTGVTEAQLRVLLDNRPGHSRVARAIVWAWYTGQFMTPYEVPDAPQTPEEYADGLLWRVIKAHPPGFKGQGYASWAKLPT